MGFSLSVCLCGLIVTMKSAKVIYELANLSRHIALKQLIAACFTSICSYNTYQSFAFAPIFGLHWGYHLCFAVYGVTTMARSFLFEACTVSEISLLEDGKRLSMRTSGLFPYTREMRIKELSSRWETDKVFISIPFQGFFIVHLKSPALSSSSTVSIPDIELLKQVLGGQEVKHS